MIRLLKIEWFKIKSYRTFWFFLLAYFIMIILLFLSPQVLTIGPIKFLSSETLKFPYVWQNITFLVSKFFNLLMAILVISLITNEFTYRTIRQNIIDGLSKEEFITSKILLITTLSLAITIFVLLFGLVIGFINSESVGAGNIFERSSFILGIFIQSFAILSFATFLAFVLQRTGLAVVIFLLYILVFESIIRNYLEGDFTKYFPSKAIHSIISTPYHELLNTMPGMAIQSTIFDFQLLAAIIYSGLFLFGSYYLIKKKDI